VAEFIYSNVKREMEVYGYDSVVKSHCRMCHGGCGVLVYTKNGRVEKIAGDPDCPINHGTLCSKGIASAQLAYHPARLTYPVKRLGRKGSGKWERISWDEALNTIAGGILDYKEKFGAESIVMGYGTVSQNRKRLKHRLETHQDLQTKFEDLAEKFDSLSKQMTPFPRPPNRACGAG